MQKIALILRSLATLTVFGVFSLGAVLLGVPVFFLLSLVIRNGRKRCLVLRGLVKSSFRFIVFLSGIMFVFRVHFRDVEDEKDSAATSDRSMSSSSGRGRIYISNHPTLVDYVILLTHTEVTVNTMVKHSLTVGFMRHIINHLGYVNNLSSLDEVSSSLENGDSLLIFPEGSRTHGDICFKRGAANLASRLDMDIVPIFIYCSEPEYLSRGFLNIMAPKHVPHFYIERHRPIKVADMVPEDNLPPAVRARHLNRYLEKMYREKIPELKSACDEGRAGF